MLALIGWFTILAIGLFALFAAWVFFGLSGFGGGYVEFFMALAVAILLLGAAVLTAPFQIVWHGL